MQIVRRDTEGARVVTDAWVQVQDTEPVPTWGDVVVPLARRLREPEVGTGRDGRLGLRVPGETDATELARLLDGLALIEVEFPKFTDGRGYSLARLLRDRHGYRGELRAVGHVLRDQVFFMARCGFDSFVMAEGQSLDEALTAFDDFSLTYQPAADHDQPIWARRRAAG